MAVIRLTRDDVESIELVTTPLRTYSSSSSGVTGSIKVFPRLSSYEKDSENKRRLFDESRPDVSNDVSVTEIYSKVRATSEIKRKYKQSIYNDINKYVTTVDSASVKANQTLEITRFTPTTTETRYTALKNYVKDILLPHYAVQNTNPEWAYKNYHSLNFFTTAKNDTTASVLLYPNVTDSAVSDSRYVGGIYTLTGGFTFDFYINPRYKSDGLDTSQFKAGTIFHLSSSYAVSLVTGSARDTNNRPIGFRMQLQLSHSADVSPSSTPASLSSTYPNDLVFRSDDNSLSWNNWHHVVIRWGGNTINDGTGSFIIDGRNRGNFVVPSASIALAPMAARPYALCVGNYYEGNNTADDSQSFFFTPQISTREGVAQLTTDTTQDGPDVATFSHPLKAEVHDLMIRRYYLSDKEMTATGSTGPGLDALSKKNFAFYLPPFFTQDSPIRRYTQGVAGKWGGVFQTPFYTVDGTTDDPFNVAMSFGVNGHYINLENFTKDFTSGRFPRLMQLTGSVIDYTTSAEEANSFIYRDKQMVKRNLSVLPCDDGLFDPDFSILTRENYKNKFVDYFGRTDYSLITLDNLVNSRTLFRDDENYRQYETEIYGFSPEFPGLAPGAAVTSYNSQVNTEIASDSNFDRGIQAGVPLTIYQRLKDPSSNQLTFFNISNLYYGSRILPGSFVLTDSSLTGSSGAVTITLKDDGWGGLYRADSQTAHAKTNTVGHVFYDEGLVMLKNPHLYGFGKSQFDMSFKGVKKIYTTKYEVVAPANTLNSSSNPTYIRNETSLSPTGNPGDKEKFVYIDAIYFHDNNMNVVAKAKLAQPIMKRETDKILFKVGFDW
jgi:hypothetical protein